MAEAARDISPPEQVAAYKRLLAALIERRPSGTRQRLATALAKNRSFVSQITNPAYPTPIPASHLDLIFEVCHFSEKDRKEFIRLYALAHRVDLPRRVRGAPRSRCTCRTSAMTSATENCTAWSAASCGIS